MTTSTVCILTAGKGTRMGTLGLVLNKALHTIDGKAIITHIINKFPQETEFVIGVGFLSQQVQQYLSIAHGNRKIRFVEIDNFDRPGSGPGYSLMCCKDQLQKPFYFVSCDTLWDNEIDWKLDINWFGVAKVNSEESHNYCNLKVSDGKIIDILDKTTTKEGAYQAFVGLCFIKDYSLFWQALGNPEKIAGEHQISTGINALIAKAESVAMDVEWTDVGDAAKYKKAVSKYENYDFSKENEALYIVDQKVIKFFADPVITTHRVEKSAINPVVFPPISYHQGQFYAYDFQPGETFYQIGNPEIFNKLLDWLGSKLWERQNIEPTLMRATCLKFYQAKTIERLKMYRCKYENSDSPSIVNGEPIPATGELLSQVPWDLLSDGIPSFMHGDLQFDNILYNSTQESFILLDWRQDFGGNVEFGDLYYDLAKLYGGIILNYDYIKLNLLSYNENKQGITFDFAQRFQTPNYLADLSKYIVDNGYDLTKVRIIVALIYLNMSPLHHFPFDKLLYSLGRDLLHKELLKFNSIDDR
jgi:NDP-sugar pyrophosphorylase family protein